MYYVQCIPNSIIKYVAQNLVKSKAGRNWTQKICHRGIEEYGILLEIKIRDGRICQKALVNTYLGSGVRSSKIKIASVLRSGTEYEVCSSRINICEASWETCEGQNAIFPP